MGIIIFRGLPRQPPSGRLSVSLCFRTR